LIKCVDAMFNCVNITTSTTQTEQDEMVNIKVHYGVSPGPVGFSKIKGISIKFSAIHSDGVRRKVMITPFGVDCMRCYSPSTKDVQFITCAQYSAILAAK